MCILNDIEATSSNVKIAPTSFLALAPNPPVLQGYVRTGSKVFNFCFEQNRGISSLKITVNVWENNKNQI